MRAMVLSLLLSSVLLSSVLLSSLLVPVTLHGQSDVTERQSATRQPDGGVRETLESIVISPAPNAPFTTLLQTEWVRTMSDGGTITLENERRIARDSQGRIYEERWALVPKNGRQKSMMTAIQIGDPIQHTVHTCMMDGRHVCEVTNYTDTASVVQEVRGTRTVQLPNDTGFVNHEDLGNGSIEGLDTAGTRITTTYNPGVFGNDNTFSVEREFWYSPQLGINLLSKVIDPRFGTQTFTVTSLSLSEPDPKLFALPDGFRAVDQRSPVSRAVR
jgi:hypothetical protein